MYVRVDTVADHTENATPVFTDNALKTTLHDDAVVGGVYRDIAKVERTYSGIEVVTYFFPVLPGIGTEVEAFFIRAFAFYRKVNHIGITGSYANGHTA